MSKYRNKRVTTPDGTFDSVRELVRWNDLKLLERTGDITDLRRQVQFELIPKIGKNRPTHYVADFVYNEGGSTVVEDAKGFRTEVYRLKQKLMRWIHKVEIRES